MTRHPAIQLVAAALATGVLAAAPALGAEPVRFGGYIAAFTDLSEPASVAVGPRGLVYIADSGNDRIVVGTPDGRVVRTFTAGVDGPGPLAGPRGVTVDDAGKRIYVSDTGNDRIVVFTAEGAPIAAWGASGTGPGDLRRPLDLTVAGGLVYVADGGNDRVQVFTTEGEPVASLGVEPGALRIPADVAVSDNGRAFITDSLQHRIAVYDADGTMVRQIGDRGSFPGMVTRPMGIDIQGGRLYVADSENHRVQVFDGNAAAYQWGVPESEPHQGGGRIHEPIDIAIAPDGSFAAVCESLENRVQIFGPATPDDLRREELAGALTAGARTHYGPPVATVDRLVVLMDPGAESISIYDASRPTPILINEFGRPGGDIGLFGSVSGLAARAGAGDALTLVVTDRAMRRLSTWRLAWDPAAELRYIPVMSALAVSIDLAAIDVPGGGASWPVDPAAAAIGTDGSIYIADAANDRVLVLGAEYQAVRTFGSTGAGAGELRDPRALAIVPRHGDSDLLAVADSGNDRIQVFDGGTGAVVYAWGGRGSDIGRFRTPSGIASLGDGTLVISDTHNHRMVRSSVAGDPVAVWGRRGVGAGELYKPRGVAVDSDGNIVVVDHGNHRVVFFEPDGTFIRAMGAPMYVRPTRAAPPDETAP